jgi:hypothetical protein
VRLRWNRLGGQLGMAVSLLGLLLVFLGWNGAASYDRVPSQFPYLISGGIAGLSLVVIGAALLIVQSSRDDRAALQSSIAELRETLERVTSSPRGPAEDQEEVVVAGRSSYHRPSCRLVEGRGVLAGLTIEEAEARGLTPCRSCHPASRRKTRPVRGLG